MSKNNLHINTGRFYRGGQENFLLGDTLNYSNDRQNASTNKTLKHYTPFDQERDVLDLKYPALFAVSSRSTNTSGLRRSQSLRENKRYRKEGESLYSGSNYCERRFDRSTSHKETPYLQNNKNQVSHFSANETSRNMAASELGCSLSSILRDDLENLRSFRVEQPSRSDRIYHSNTVASRDLSINDSHPNAPPRLRRPHANNFLNDVPESPSQQNSSDVTFRYNEVECNNFVAKKEELANSSESLSDYSSLNERDIHRSNEYRIPPRRLSLASKFREYIHESHRAMFQSIGRELGTPRSSNISAVGGHNSHMQRSGSLVDIYKHDIHEPVRRISEAGIVNRFDGYNLLGEETSRTSRVIAGIPQRSLGHRARGQLPGITDERVAHDGISVVEQVRRRKNITREPPVTESPLVEDLTESSIDKATPIMSQTLTNSSVKSNDSVATKKLIVDEQKIQELFLKCHVCGETYNKTDKVPKLLSCHHTFCLWCLCEIHKVETENRQNMLSNLRSHAPTAVRMSCPTCRDAVVMTMEEVRKLPSDRTVLTLLELVTQSDFCVVVYCSKHQTQPLNFFCESCVIPICCDCTVLEHSLRDGHNVLNFTEALEKYSPMVDVTLDALDDHYREMVENKNKAEIVVSNLRSNCEDVSTKLKETFEHFRSAATDRRDELLEITQSESGKKLEELALYMDTIKNKRKKLGDDMKRLQESRNNSNVVDVFTITKELKELSVDKLDAPDSFSTDMPTNLKFDIEEQKNVLDKLGSFGDIHFEHSLSSGKDRN